MSQLKIEVTGGIHVKGTVENANLKSGNNIIVGSGIISESIPNVNEPPKITTILEAGNDIQAMFINLTEAWAGNDILIQKYVMHSNIRAKHDILVGDKGGKGAIICGNAECGHVLKANIIGSDAYLKTIISCGPREALREEKRAVDKSLKQRSSEHVQLLNILEKVEARSDTEKVGSVLLHKKIKITAAINALVERLEKLNLIEEELTLRITMASGAHVEVEKTIFPKTLVSINDSSQLVTIEKRKCKIICRDGGINFE